MPVPPSELLSNLDTLANELLDSDLADDIADAVGAEADEDQTTRVREAVKGSSVALRALLKELDPSQSHLGKG